MKRSDTPRIVDRQVVANTGGIKITAATVTSTALAALSTGGAKMPSLTATGPGKATAPPAGCGPTSRPPGSK